MLLIQHQEKLQLHYIGKAPIIPNPILLPISPILEHHNPLACSSKENALLAHPFTINVLIDDSIVYVVVMILVQHVKSWIQIVVPDMIPLYYLNVIPSIPYVDLQYWQSSLLVFHSFSEVSISVPRVELLIPWLEFSISLHVSEETRREQRSSAIGY